MRALVLTQTGGPEHLALADLPAPVPAAGEVRVRVRAAALNHLDLFVAGGLPGIAYTFPHVVGADGMGVVDALGPGVTGVRAGDRVMLNPGISCMACPACLAGEPPLCPRFALLGEHRPGTAAEHVCVPAANVTAAPEAFSDAEAAAFSLATLTAWRMLTSRARLRAAETLLVWGAGGGVAQACVQIGALLGARVIATSSSDDKLALARTLGAHETINHATEDVVARVRAIAGKAGVDVVAETVGTATWERSLKVLRAGGRLVTCGATSGPMVGLDVRKLFWYQWSILGSTMGSHREYAEIASLARDGKLRPVVDRAVPLAEAVALYARMAGGAQAGKLVLEVA